MLNQNPHAHSRQQLVILGLFAATFALITSFAEPAIADDLEDQGLPVFRNRGGFALAVSEYEAKTEASFLKGKKAEYTLSIEGLLQAPKDVDVLCFATKMTAQSAIGDRRKNLLVPQRKKSAIKDFKAVLPMQDFKTRRSEPMPLSKSELSKVELDRPAYEIETLEVEVAAVVVEKRTSEEVPAIVADRYIDIGNDTEVKITGKEISDKRVMTVTLNVKRAAGTRSAIIDSVIALDEDGKEVGGGRWQNDLDLFSRGYDVEVEFPLKGKESIESLRIVLATKYEVQRVRLEIEGLFQR